MQIDELKTFQLAGGTALALHIGHRESYDLDLFGETNLAVDELLLVLRDHFDCREMHRTPHILVLEIQGIKVDLVKYEYPRIAPMHTLDDIRLYALEDIGAMKLEAVKGRGRRRDFYDLYFLLRHFSLEELLALHHKKFRHDDRFLILKSLTYFEDAESDPPIKLIGKEAPSWEHVKGRMTEEVRKSS